MLLIAILLALFAERMWPNLSDKRSLRPFEHYLTALEARSKLSGALALSLALLPWVVLAGVLQALLWGVLWGVLELVFGALVLFFALRPGGLDPAVDRYVAAREQQDEATARHQAEHILGGSAPLALEDEVRAVADALLLQANERWVAPILWFVLLGPVGAVLYRLTAQVEMSAGQDDLRASARWLRAAMDWIPARVLAGLYTLSGSFEEGLGAWRQPKPEVRQDDAQDAAAEKPHRADELEDDNRDVLLRVGRAALRHEDYSISNELGETGEMEVDASLVRAARGLVLRALIIVVAMVALLTLGEWVR